MTDTTLHPTSAAPPRAGLPRWGRLLAWAGLLGLLAPTGWGLWLSRLTQVAAGAAPDFALTQSEDPRTLILC